MSLFFKDFDDIKVSTKTYVISLNVKLNTVKLFEKLPITPYVVVPKRRGRKRKVQIEDPNKNIQEGSIITLSLGNNVRGVLLKKRKKNTYFRNSITIVMIIDGKNINFKIGKNGTIQMTGCKCIEHAYKCVKYLWNCIKYDNDMCEYTNTEITATIIPAMRNIDFSLGFNVDRPQLDTYINMNTDYNSLLETSFGYTGVNIKIPVTKNISELKQLVYICGEWEERNISYSSYLNSLSPKEKAKKINKQHYNTFLVFQSGKIIMSGTSSELMKDVYYEFLDIIRDCQHIIREKDYDIEEERENIFMTK